MPGQRVAGGPAAGFLPKSELSARGISRILGCTRNAAHPPGGPGTPGRPHTSARIAAVGLEERRCWRLGRHRAPRTSGVPPAVAQAARLRQRGDITKVWPHGDYPLVEVGKMALDRNPVD